MRPMRPGRWLLLLAMAAGSFGPAPGAAIKPLHRFAYVGTAPSHYSLGSTPYAELLQASDGNFYGTTVYGGAGRCPNRSNGSFLGCGTIFSMTPAGAVTTLYSFPYDTATSQAPNGAFPTAGLIQGSDGLLYGVAQDGGQLGCNGALGCGTAFRISIAGAFKRLHQFSPTDGEGGRPYSHLVQTANGLLYGVANEGGTGNEGTLYSMTTNGAVHVLHKFDYTTNNDGYNPTGALLVGHDGKTLYGTTTLGGANGNSVGGGIIFSYADGVLTTLHAFDNIQSSAAGTFYQPEGALIYGPDGNLYGTTVSGGSGGGLFSISPTGTGFKVHYVFNGGAPFNGEAEVAGPVLGRDGLIYGLSNQTSQGSEPGSIYRYTPANGRMLTVAPFSGSTGGNPQGGLIEGKDRYLYGTTSLYGGSNAQGPDAGTVFRIAPALAK